VVSRETALSAISFTGFPSTTSFVFDFDSLGSIKKNRFTTEPCLLIFACESRAAFYELSLFEEAQAELNKIDPSAADSILVIAFRLGIAHSRRDWNERKPLPEGSHESNSVAQLESFSCHSHHRFGWPKSHLEDMRKKA
jgi:hypothetical protein